VAPRFRIVAFGLAGALVVAGAACGVLVRGVTGQALLIGFTLVGLGGALLLAFLEVGLSEDRDRERDELRRRRSVEQREDRPRRSRMPRRPRRPG
jgi:hypothetical protein